MKEIQQKEKEALMDVNAQDWKGLHLGNLVNRLNKGRFLFSLLRSSLVCLRGSRNFKRTTNDINNVDMDIEVAESSIL